MLPDAKLEGGREHDLHQYCIARREEKGSGSRVTNVLLFKSDTSLG